MNDDTKKQKTFPINKFVALFDEMEEVDSTQTYFLHYILSMNTHTSACSANRLADLCHIAGRVVQHSWQSSATQLAVADKT